MAVVPAAGPLVQVPAQGSPVANLRRRQTAGGLGQGGVPTADPVVRRNVGDGGQRADTEAAGSGFGNAGPGWRRRWNPERPAWRERRFHRGFPIAGRCRRQWELYHPARRPAERRLQIETLVAAVGRSRGVPQVDAAYVTVMFSNERQGERNGLLQGPDFRWTSLWIRERYASCGCRGWTREHPIPCSRHPLFERLHIEPEGEYPCFYANGDSEMRNSGVAAIRIGERTNICPVIFGPDGHFLLGATTLEIFKLAVDPVGQELIPARGLRLGWGGEI